MKKFLTAILACILLASSAYGVEINSANFPDETFRDILSSDFDADGDGSLSQEEIAQITQITANGVGLSSLEGVEYLTSLQYLDCSGNYIALLDLSSNTALTDLICSDNQLIWLNIDNCSLLQTLAILSNDIPELNISGCPDLYSEDIDGEYTFFFEHDESTAIIFESVPNPALDSAPTIRANNIPRAEIGLPFSFTLKAYGTRPITWSVSGTLPDGLTLSDDTILGVPEVSGDFAVTLRAENSFGDDTRTITISAADTVTICPERFPDEKFRAWFTAMERDTFDGDGKFSREELARVTEIDISDGVDVIVDGVQFTGRIESLSGIENFSALEKLSCGENNLGEIVIACKNLKQLNCRDSRINFLDVSGCESLVSLDCTSNRLNILDLSNNSALKECHCDINPLYSLNIDSCPAMSYLSLTGTGLPKLNVSGCPELFTREDGTYTYHFAFDDVTQIVFDTVTDDPFAPKLPPVISRDSLAAATVSRSYMTRLSASGAGSVIWTLESGRLPEGMSFDSSGMIYGIPARAGTSSFTVKASNDYGADTAGFTLQAAEAVTITTDSLKSGKIGRTYIFTLKSSGTSPVTWTAEGLPQGLTLSERGRISGWPEEFGTFSVKFTASNSAGSAEAILPLTIKGIAPKLSGSLAKAALNSPYSSGLRLKRGSTPMTWSISGTLPDGLTFDTSTGIISGTPVSYSRSGFRLRITAANGAGSKTKSARLTVKGTRPKIATSTLPDATQRQAYSAKLSATGSTPLTWTAVNLPAGLTLSGDTITGTPSASGTFRVRIMAENPVKYARKILTLKVSPSDDDTKLPVRSAPDGESYTAGGTAQSGAGTGYSGQATGTYAGGYVIVGELGVISCDEEGLYEFGLTLSADAHEGDELIYIANSDNPSDDDDIAEFYDDTGAEILPPLVPENRRITIGIWLNPDTIYNPVIAVPSR
ncbi:MAG: putative Ig domain-containing protein [Synergistaceae bacterium]|nr:putative Ig domain-containing protein [Synergistaceae bacterium]